MLMGASPVVVVHQVVADVPFCFLEIQISRLWDPFCLQASEYPLHGGVIPAVAATAHALGYPITPQPLPKFPTGILATLIAVKQHSPWAASLLISHIKGFHHQISIRLIGQSPTNHPPSTEIEYHRQVMPATAGPDVGDITAPSVVGLRNCKLTRQQIRDVWSLIRCRFIGMRAWLLRYQTRFFHQATYLESTNLMPQLTQARHQGAATSRVPTLLEQASHFAPLLQPFAIYMALACQVLIKG